MFLLMLFMFFFFLGFVAMFAYLLRKLDEQTRSINEEHAQMRVLLRALESRLDKIGQTQRIGAMLQGNLPLDAVLPGDERTGENEGDSLLHLSFDKPQTISGPVNPGLSLDLEPGGWEPGNQRV